MTRKIKIGLALGSGAARGWAHIGVIKRLQALGIEPDVVCGTSIGALVGAAYVAGNIDRLDAWVRDLGKLETARYFTLNNAFKGFVNKERLSTFLNKYVGAKDLRIEELDTPFASVATDLDSGREIWNTQGLLMDAVWSSISLPGLFPAIKHDERWLIDGGLVNPVPVSVCRALGADVVIAVNLNSDIVGKHVVEDSENKTKEDETLTGRISTMVTDYTDSLFGGTKDEDEAPDLWAAIAGSINIIQDRITRSRMAGDPPEIIVSPRLARIGLLEFYRAAEAIEEGSRCIDKHKADLEHLLGINIS